MFLAFGSGLEHPQITEAILNFLLVLLWLYFLHLITGPTRNLL